MDTLATVLSASDGIFIPNGCTSHDEVFQCLHILMISRQHNTGLEIELIGCTITCATVLAGVLGSNQGPTKLDRFLYWWHFRWREWVVRKQSSAELGTKEGLVELILYYKYITNEILSRHIRHLRYWISVQQTGLQGFLSSSPGYRQYWTCWKWRLQYSRFVWIPVIITNMKGQSFLISRRIGSGRAFLPSKNSPVCIQCQGAGTSAFCCTSRSQSLLDASIRECLPSTTATTIPAANIPTPATGAPPVDVAPAAATASGASASNILASASGQKRKVCL
jgi:hypothetical protein